MDTKGPEIRSGIFKQGIDKVDLVKGEWLGLTSDYNYRGDNQKLACSYEKLASSVVTGQQILVADGSLVLTVLSCDIPANEITCRIENNCSIGERKNMNLPGVKVDLLTFTEKDVKDIVEFGIAQKVEFIAASFVRKAEDVRNLKKLLSDNGGDEIKVISKIENQEGLENYDAILKETDGVMVARGDVRDLLLLLLHFVYVVVRILIFSFSHTRHFILLYCLLLLARNGNSREQGVFGTKVHDPQGQHCGKTGHHRHSNAGEHDHQSSPHSCRMQ